MQCPLLWLRDCYHVLSDEYMNLFAFNLYCFITSIAHTWHFKYINPFTLLCTKGYSFIYFHRLNSDTFSETLHRKWAQRSCALLGNYADDLSPIARLSQTSPRRHSEQNSVFPGIKDCKINAILRSCSFQLQSEFHWSSARMLYQIAQWHLKQTNQFLFKYGNVRFLFIYSII